MNVKTIVFLAWIVEIPCVAYSGNSSSLPFLKLGTTAHNLAMGDAGVAYARGAGAVFYNPSAIADRQTHSGYGFSVMHKEWLQDTRMQFLGGFTHIGEASAIAFSITHLTVSDIEIRTRPGDADGVFTSRDFAAGITFATGLSEDLFIGITAKYLLEKIFVDNTSGLAFDVGAKWNSPIDGLTLGATIAHIGSMSDLRNEKPTLPVLARLGAAFQGTADQISSAFVLVVEVEQDFPGSQTYGKIGGELRFQDAVAVRSGYHLGAEARGFSAGAGFFYSMFAFDYAFAPLTNDLGSTHTFSLSIYP